MKAILLVLAATMGCAAAPESLDRGTASITGTIAVGTTLRATDNVHLRSAPDATSSSLRLVPAGAIVTVVSDTPKSGFYEVRYDGIVGFSHGDFYAKASSDFSYTAAGTLVPTGAGKGRVDDKVYAPGMRFPIESGPAYANSQVWGHGGYLLGKGAECDVENFSYPWHDNFCEVREWTMPLCPSGVGHQGQDIRPATCKNRVHWSAATVDGTITSASGPGTGTPGYQVLLVGADGTRYRYLHMSDVLVSVGQKVKRGQRLGSISREFNGTPTTVHLHFDLLQNVSGLGLVFVPTYMSLVRSYEALIGATPPKEDAGADVSEAAVDGAVVDSAVVDSAVVEDASPADTGEIVADAVVPAPETNAATEMSGSCSTSRASGPSGATWLLLLVAFATCSRSSSRGSSGSRRSRS